MNQRRRGNYTGNKYDLPLATHWYNTRAQGKKLEQMAQHVAVIVINMWGNHQSNVVIDPIVEMLSVLAPLMINNVIVNYAL